MKLYAPSYYKRFKCIADKCKSSCCVDWEIDIDDTSYAKYAALGSALTDSICECDGVRCFALSDDGRCPHLNRDGLCSIIINYGEEYLTDICREHPRFYHLIGGRREVGIGLVCEEAARIIITDKEPFALCEIGECDISDGSSGTVALAERDAALAFLSNSDESAESVMISLCREYSLDPDIHTLPEWLDILAELEILDGEWEHIITDARNAAGADACDFCDGELKNLLAYFLFRHASLATSPLNLRARIAFSILSVKIIRYLFERTETRSIDAFISIARLYSSEIEYSEENTEQIIFELESGMI